MRNIFTEGLFGLTSVFTTGCLTLIVFILIFFSSLPCIRRSGHFEVFWYMHQILFVLFYVFLLFHGVHHGIPVFWVFFLVPGCIYFFDRLYRTLSTSQGSIYTLIHSATIVSPPNASTMDTNKDVSGAVIRLEIHRPKGWAFQPGQYGELQCPDISKHEWHPFTVASSPSAERDLLRFYIKVQV